MARDPDSTARLRSGGVLHAVESEYAHWIMWVRPACQRAWRTVHSIDGHYDYRMREGRLCRHPACQLGFEKLVD